MLPATHGAIWAIVALALSGVICRPWRVPEAVWAVLGATVLVGLGLLSWTAAWHAIGKGSDVYLFLTGMMLLAELARREGSSTGWPPTPRGTRTGLPNDSSRSSTVSGRS